MDCLLGPRNMARWLSSLMSYQILWFYIYILWIWNFIYNIIICKGKINKRMNSCLTLTEFNKHGVCFRLLANNFIHTNISNWKFTTSIYIYICVCVHVEARIVGLLGCLRRLTSNLGLFVHSGVTNFLKPWIEWSHRNRTYSLNHVQEKLYRMTRYPSFEI